MSTTPRSAVLLLLLAGAVPALGQGGSQKPETPPQTQPREKVWTNEDLQKLPPGGVNILGGGPVVAPPPATTQRGERWWRAQAQLLREREQKTEAARADAEKLLGLASNPYTRPMARTSTGEMADPAKVRSQIEELDRALAATRRAMSELTEAARQAEVPKAWIQPPPPGPVRKEPPPAEVEPPSTP